MTANFECVRPGAAEQPQSIAVGYMRRRSNWWPAVVGLKPGLPLLMRFLRKIIRRGTLRVIAPDGRSYSAGCNDPRVTIRIVDPTIIPRLVLRPYLAFGEAYTAGAIEIVHGDIYQFLDLCLGSLPESQKNSMLRDAFAWARRVFRRIAQHNPIRAARANAAHHYDLSDTLYEQFLDADRQYSCAYFLSPNDTLESAQENKKRHIAAKLLLRPGQNVLDIGSGWGGLAIYLARVAGVDATGLTLSEAQHAYSQRRAGEYDIRGHVRFFLKDYRQENNKYDRVVSVGMFEHVGVGDYRAYFRKIHMLLKDEGVALVHTIGRPNGSGGTNPWIKKYIFPGGYVPALSEILPAIEEAGLYVTDIEVLRLHYAETLKAWRQRFMANRELAGRLHGEQFYRMWEFYLAGCEAAFRQGRLVNFQIQLSPSLAAVPLNRDYIREWEQSRIEDVPLRAMPGRCAFDRKRGSPGKCSQAHKKSA